MLGGDVHGRHNNKFKMKWIHLSLKLLSGAIFYFIGLQSTTELWTGLAVAIKIKLPMKHEDSAKAY